MATDTTDQIDIADLEESTAQFKTIKRWFEQDAQCSAKWRREAKEEFAFVAGDQWDAEDRSTLSEQGRPCITFNRTLSIIKAVAGTEINGRHETRYIPRSSEDVKVNEVLTAASQWMGDECDAEDEQSEAFQHSVITGMGWTEVRMDYEDDPNGKYVEEWVDPLEMYWDGKARKKNLVDASRVHHVRTMPIEEARRLFPGFGDDELHAGWAVSSTMGDVTKTDEEKRHREENVQGIPTLKEVTIVRTQWFDREEYVLVLDPFTGQTIEKSPDEFALIEQRYNQLMEMSVAQTQAIPELKSARLTRKVYKQAFTGGVVLEVGPAPCKDHFSFQCITGERDRNENSWFGLVRLMRDPQKWANKWLSQTLHIMNSTAKGGIIAEKKAFDDQRQAEDTYASPDVITWANDGAISEGKIMPKPGQGFPQGHQQLLEFAISSIRDVTGINLELLGMRDANQPGILEAQRKQAAMTILATMFDSLRRFRKIVGRIRLYFIQEYMSDGRLIRIVGDDGSPEAVQLTKDKTIGEYDVIVDDAPTSPNQKEQNWVTIQPLLVAFKEQIANNPELAVAALEMSPAPSKFVDKVKEVVGRPPSEDQVKAKQLAEAAQTAKVGRDQAAAQKDLATAEQTRMETSAALMQIQGALTTMAAQLQTLMGAQQLPVLSQPAQPVMDPAAMMQAEQQMGQQAA